jgi:hypothetical protein
LAFSIEGVPLSVSRFDQVESGEPAWCRTVVSWLFGCKIVAQNYGLVPMIVKAARMPAGVWAIFHGQVPLLAVVPKERLPVAAVAFFLTPH